LISISTGHPDTSKTINEGVIEPWTKPKYKPLAAELKRFARQEGIPLDVPWRSLIQSSSADWSKCEGRYAGVRGFFTSSGAQEI